MNFHGSNAAEKMSVSANGSRVRLFRDVGAVTMDFAGIETLDMTALGGSDTVTFDDLTGTELNAANVDLGGTPGGAGDAQADTVIANGTTAPTESTSRSPARRCRSRGCRHSSASPAASRERRAAGQHARGQRQGHGRSRCESADRPDHRPGRRPVGGRPAGASLHSAATPRLIHSGPISRTRPRRRSIRRSRSDSQPEEPRMSATATDIVTDIRERVDALRWSELRRRLTIAATRSLRCC